MDLDKAVFVVTTAGEQILGERVQDREVFDLGAAIMLKNARRFEAQHLPVGAPDATGKAMVRIVFDLVPIEPFTHPAGVTFIVPSRWIHVADSKDDALKDMLCKLIKRAENREIELRASAAGIHLGGPQVSEPRRD